MGNINISRPYRGRIITAANSEIVNGSQVIDVEISDGFAVHGFAIRGNVSKAMAAAELKIDAILDIECYCPETTEEYADIVLRQ